MIEHSKGLKKIVKKRISQGYNYMETLKSLYGADPREVWDVFKRFKKEKNRKIGIANPYPNFPEPHPAFSQWRITPESAKIILNKLLDKKYNKICFLGCPVLGSEFSKASKTRPILLDIDTGALNYAAKLAKTISYDVNDSLPAILRNRFECVVIDPPWYYDDILLFVKRALELTKIGGTIYLSLPGLLTRPSIISERLGFQKRLSRLGLVIAEMDAVVEYGVPPFEYMAYRNIPAFTGEVWRIGDWVKLKKAEEIDKKPERKSQRIKIKWLEYTFDKKRLFLREKKNDKSKKPRLSFLYSDNSQILKTVSKRSSLIPRIDIWTSRNAVLHIDEGFKIIKFILDNFDKKDEKIIKKIIDKYGDKYKGECIDSIKKIRKLISV